MQMDGAFDQILSFLWYLKQWLITIFFALTFLWLVVILEYFSFVSFDLCMFFWHKINKYYISLHINPDLAACETFDIDFHTFEVQVLILSMRKSTN